MSEIKKYPHCKEKLNSNNTINESTEIIKTNDKEQNICNGCFGAANNDCNLCNRHN